MPVSRTMTTRGLRFALYSSAFAFTGGLASTCWAQDSAPAASDSALSEIIVTAQKRSENLQSVPVAITAVTSEALEASHIQNTQDLAALTPGLVSFQGIGFSMPHIRGIGTTVAAVGIENPVSTYVDGVFYASMPASILSLNNVAQVEVAKGPQGTLFGRNATGGVLQITTRDPSQTLSGNLSLGYGNYQTINNSLYLTGGLSENLAADLAVYYNNRLTGYATNLSNGRDIGDQEDLAVRTKWLWTPTEQDRITVAFDYADSSGTAYINARVVPGTVPFGVPPSSSSNPWDVNSFLQPKTSVKQGGGSLKVQHDFNFAELVSITAYRKTKALSLFGYAFPPFDVNANLTQQYKQFSQELQLVSGPDSPVKWTVGAFYLNATGRSKPFTLYGNFVRLILGLPSDLTTTNKVTDESEALFAQATVPLSERTNVTAGIRYTWEQRGIKGTTGLVGIPASFIPVDAKKSFKAPSWRFVLDHHFTDDLMAYASYNRGFRAGTFNGNGGSAVELETPIDQEKLDAYEIGMKGEFFDRRVRFNAAAFYYNYSNIQIQSYTISGVFVQSGPKATLYGLDMDLEAAITNELTVQGGLALLHTKFGSFPNAPFFINSPFGGLTQFEGEAKGNELPAAPKHTFNVGATYRLPLNEDDALTFSANYYYKSRWFQGPGNRLSAPHSNMLNGSIAWSMNDDQLKFSVWGRNLLNEQVRSLLVENPFGEFETLDPPRTYGATLQYKF